MIFIHDKESGQFLKMISPHFMEYFKNEDPCALYVYDSCGRSFKLIFRNRDRLADAVRTLSFRGIVNAFCDCVVGEIYDPFGDREREIQLHDLDDQQIDLSDLGEDHGREI